MELLDSPVSELIHEPNSRSNTISKRDEKVFDLILVSSDFFESVISVLPTLVQVVHLFIVEESNAMCHLLDRNLCLASCLSKTIGVSDVLGSHDSELLALNLDAAKDLLVDVLEVVSGLEVSGDSDTFQRSLIVLSGGPGGLVALFGDLSRLRHAEYVYSDVSKYKVDGRLS